LKPGFKRAGGPSSIACEGLFQFSITLASQHIQHDVDKYIEVSEGRLWTLELFHLGIGHLLPVGLASATIPNGDLRIITIKMAAPNILLSCLAVGDFHPTQLRHPIDVMMLERPRVYAEMRGTQFEREAACIFGRVRWMWMLGAARIRRERIQLAETWTFITVACFLLWTATVLLGA